MYVFRIELKAGTGFYSNPPSRKIKKKVEQHLIFLAYCLIVSFPLMVLSEWTPTFLLLKSYLCVCYIAMLQAVL